MESLIRDYANGPEAIARAIENVPEHARANSPSADAWSINEILVHLSDAEIVYAERLRRALGDEGATVQGFDESAWGDRLHYSARDPRLALDLFAALRRSNADLLSRLRRDDWDRTVIHSEDGPMTVTDLLRTLVEHLDYHLAQIVTLKTAHGIR